MRDSDDMDGGYFQAGYDSDFELNQDAEPVDTDFRRAGWMLLLVAAIEMIAALTFACTAGADTQTSSLKYAPGTWYQPAERFPAVRASGVRTIVGYAATVDLDTWCAALRANGLTAWCQYTRDTSAYFATHPDNLVLLAGWEALPDEPNSGMPTAPTMPAGQLADEIRSIRQAWPVTKVMVNLDGRPLRFAARADVAAYAQCGADLIMFDIYVTNDGDVAAGTIGMLLDLLHATGPPGLDVIACLEDCDQDLKVSDWGVLVTAARGTMRGPAPAEVKAEAAEAIAHGAAGVVWFEQVIGKGWESFYGVTADVAAVLPAVNASITPGTALPAPPAPPPPIVVTPATQPIPALNLTQVTINGVVYNLTKAGP